MTTVLPRNRWLWLIAGALMVLELFVFDRLAARRQGMVYPRWSDQIQYLSESYYSYDQLEAHGWWHGLLWRDWRWFCRRRCENRQDTLAL